MKAIALIAIPLLAVAVASPSFAADKKKKRPIKDKPLPDVVIDDAAVTLLKPFDKDGNYEIDKSEFPALAKAYADNPTGDLKVFDLNHDGTLDDTVDRAGLNNRLGTVPAKKLRDEAEAKRQARVARAKAAEAKGNN